MPNFPGDSGSAAQKTIASALTTAVSASSGGWNSSQDVNCTALNLTISLPTPTIADFGKAITLRNVGANPFAVALTGGTLNSAVGLTVNPGSVWTIEAQTLTTANVSATNAAQAVVAEYLEAIASSNSTNLVGGTDHIKFATVTTFRGTSISLDTSTPYNATNNSPSIGRFTLQPGQTYSLEGDIGDVGGGASGNYIAYDWVNADTGLIIQANQGGSNIIGANLSNTNAGRTTAYATFTPSVVTRVELRIRLISGVTGYGGQFATNNPTARIKVIAGQAAVSTTPTTPQGFALVNISNPSIVPPVAITSANAVGSTLLGGNLATTSGNNGIICKAGKTYFVEVALSIDNYGGANTNFPFASFDICSNMSTTVLPGSSTGRATMQNLQSTPSIGAGNTGGPRPAYAFFTPTVDTPVNVTVRTMGQAPGGAAITAVLITGTMSVIEVGMTGTVVLQNPKRKLMLGAAGNQTATNATYINQNNYGTSFKNTFGSAWNNATGVFTAPENMDVRVVFSHGWSTLNASANTILSLRAIHSGGQSLVKDHVISTVPQQSMQMSLEQSFSLLAGETLTFGAYQSSGTSPTFAPAANVSRLTITEE
jgi:hypothetical protein